ncbi:MAG: N-acetyl-gamma-glutamyl-phosphate reductase [Phycisphaeraceae bacterium]
MPIRAAILGPTGYAGYHLVDRLLRHPHAELTYLASHRDELPDVREEFPRLLGRLDDELARCRPIDAAAIAEHADVAFLALPARAAMTYAPMLLDAGLRVIDISGAYRFPEPALYERAYGHAHADPEHMADAVYGLPELNRRAIPDASLIANPGCYPTPAAIAIAPLLTHSLARREGIIVNAASGVTGAGRKAVAHLHFPEHNEAFTAYGRIGRHQHQPEIEQTLARAAGQPASVLFVPHLLPIDRGILATIYLESVDGEVTEEELFEALEDAYADEPFVRVREDLPNVKDVLDTNYCDVTVRRVETGDSVRIVVFSTIDNVIKGASGQAIQNMNLMFDVDETAGLL